MSETQICTKCVMDTTDSKITFDDKGICDHCNTYFTDILPKWNPEGLDDNSLYTRGGLRVQLCTAASCRSWRPCSISDLAFGFMSPMPWVRNSDYTHVAPSQIFFRVEGIKKTLGERVATVLPNVQMECSYSCAAIVVGLGLGLGLGFRVEIRVRFRVR